MKEESYPCIFCGWAMGEREGKPLCDHCKKSDKNELGRKDEVSKK